MVSEMCRPASPLHLFCVLSSLKPPAQPGRGLRGGGRHVKDGALPDWRAHEVEVGAQHDEDGEEGEAKAEASEGAFQSEADPVDEPEGKKAEINICQNVIRFVFILNLN